MISYLANSFRALALYDASVKSILAAQPRQIIQLRFKSVEEKLGLPAKPKKPIAPYFRFVKENRPTVVAKHPELKSFEINSILGKMWQTLDSTGKAKFSKGYQTELIDYFSNEYTKYRSSLSEEDKRKIKQTKLKIKKRRILVAKQRKIRQLDKPKKPFNSFFRYFAAQSDRKPNEPYKNYVERITSRWNTLSDAEKEKYKTSAEEELKYKKALLQWEHEMLKLGHDDIIRATTKKLPKSRNRDGSQE